MFEISLPTGPLYVLFQPRQLVLEMFRSNERCCSSIAVLTDDGHKLGYYVYEDIKRALHTMFSHSNGFMKDPREFRYIDIDIVRDFQVPRCRHKVLLFREYVQSLERIFHVCLSNYPLQNLLCQIVNHEQEHQTEGHTDSPLLHLLRRKGQNNENLRHDLPE